MSQSGGKYEHIFIQNPKSPEHLTKNIHDPRPLSALLPSKK